MSGVPREILRWLQSLDLSYTMKNPRRDLANGFLVAEIFSRYYSHDLSMHSFENSFSQKRKIDNWRCLERFFSKAKIPISRSVIDRVLVAEPGAAIQLLKTTYTLLTSKRIPSPEPFEESEFLPPFARPTASVVVKEKVQEAPGDLAAEQQLAMKTIEAHENILRQDRVEHPDRFSDKKPTRIPQHVLTPESSASARPSKSLQFVRQVVVKQIDAHQIDELQSSLDKTRQMPAKAAVVAISEPSTRTVNNILDDVVQRRLAHPMKAAEFVTNVASMPDGVELALQVLADLLDPELIESVSEIALQTTTQFWTLISCMSPLIQGGGHTSFHVVQRSAIQVLAQIGKAMSLHDAFRARALFADFVLPIVVDHVCKRSVISDDLVTAMFGFGPDTIDGYLDLTQRLHEALKSAQNADPDLFVGLLAQAVQIQPGFNSRSLDLFLYYIMMGIRSPSPTARTAALQIGAVLAQRCPNSVPALLQALDIFEECAYERWAPVQIALVRLLAAVLAQLPDSGRDLDQIRHILLIVVETGSVPILVSLVQTLAPCSTQQSVARDLIEYVAQHHERVRKTLLAADDGKQDRVSELVLEVIRRIDAEAA